MKLLTSKILSAAALSCLALLLAGCSSPPEPPQPMGEKVAVNPPVKQPIVQPVQEQQPVLVNDLEPLKPVLVTSPRPVDIHEFDDLRPKYRK